MKSRSTIGVFSLLSLVLVAAFFLVGPVQHAQTGTPNVNIVMIAGAFETEGDSGAIQRNFYLRRSDTSNTCTIIYRSVDGTAQAPSDYSPLSGVLTFLPGELDKFVQVQIVGDTVFELDERFRFEITSATGCQANPNFLEVTIYDNDAPGPGVSAVSLFSPGPAGAEGNFGVTQYNFWIDRVGDLTMPCTVNYITRDGTAFAPEDYTARSGTYSFTAGQVRGTITVNVIADLFTEMDETFFFDITGTTGCILRNHRSVMAEIIDGDMPGPSCSGGIEGDANLDAAIRVNDLVIMRRAILGLEPAALLGCSLQKLDITPDCGDGSVNSGDVTILRQWILQGSVQRPNCGPIGPPPLF